MKFSDQLAKHIGISIVALATFLTSASFLPAIADVERQDFCQKQDSTWRSSYIWQNPDKKPIAIAIAIHGLVMHGGSYDALARNLANEGFIVAASDMRGYGRWLDHKVQKQTGTDGQLDYDKSLEDLLALEHSLKERYPNLPLFLIGESMGCPMALHLAVSEPSLVNGLILSSPAVKRHYFCVPILSELPSFLTNPTRQIDLVPYIKKFASDDPQIIQGALADPLVRKKLSAWELLSSVNACRPTLKYAEQIPSSVPILIIQGSHDRVLKSHGVVELLAKLKSKDQTVRWFSDRGHVLLETSYIYPDTLETVCAWLNQHLPETQTAELKISPETTLAIHKAQEILRN